MVNFCTGGHARTARVLSFLVVPGHLIFIYSISYLKAGHTSFTPIFVIMYLLAALIQVSFTFISFFKNVKIKIIF